MDLSNRPPCTEADLPPVGPLDEAAFALIGRALAHPARVRIVEQFTACTPYIVQQIVEDSGLAQSTVSEHLRMLREANILFARREGPRTWYCMRRSVLREYAQRLERIADAPHLIQIT